MDGFLELLLIEELQDEEDELTAQRRHGEGRGEAQREGSGGMKAKMVRERGEG